MIKKSLILMGIVFLLLLPAACQQEPENPVFTPKAEPTAATAVSTAVPTPTPLTSCTSQNPHPIGQSISEQFETPYEQVMGWYCQGDAFSDILLALETQKIADEIEVDLEVEELLSRLKTQTWEEIWGDLGVSPEE